MYNSNSCFETLMLFPRSSLTWLFGTLHNLSNLSIFILEIHSSSTLRTICDCLIAKNPSHVVWVSCLLHMINVQVHPGIDHLLNMTPLTTRRFWNIDWCNYLGIHGFKLCGRYENLFFLCFYFVMNVEFVPHNFNSKGCSKAVYVCLFVWMNDCIETLGF